MVHFRPAKVAHFDPARVVHFKPARVVYYVRRLQFTGIYNSFLTKYDIWITPVCAIEAYKHQKAGKPFIINGNKVAYTKAIASFVFTTAFSGHPIVVIPIGKKENGMPVGIQIHSKKWTDKKLLDIAKHFENFTDKFMSPKIKTVANRV